MPSESMNIQEQGFRSSMFGGFDKNDVLAYMNTLGQRSPAARDWNTSRSCASFKSELDDAAQPARVTPKPASRP